MLEVPLSLIFAHFLGDWLLQSDRMATGKSKSWCVLAEHCAVVSLVILIWATWQLWADGSIIAADLATIWWFISMNFLAHFVIDAITSRVNAKLWFFKLYQTWGDGTKKRPYDFTYICRGGNRHWFFVSIGFDQFLHYATYALTLEWLL